MNLIRNHWHGAWGGQLAALLLLAPVAGVTAETIGPGTYHGYFAETRWGQKVFHHGPHHFFVADAAAEALKPHAGKPLEIEVLEIAQPVRIACHQVDVLGGNEAIGSMEPEESFQATLTVGRELLPDDYEVFALLTPGGQSPLTGPMSERLAFEVVAEEDEGTVLDAGAKSVKRQEVSHSMLGVRDTVVFFTFPEQKAVLRVRIGNADTKFPLEAVLHTFAADATVDGVGKWVNNQHSDALFIDAAQPAATHKLPSGLLKVESHRKTGRSRQHNGAFDDYKVKFRIGDFVPKGGPKLKGFTGEATVHVKAG